MKKHNFNAGPSILPREVIEKTAQAVLDFNGSGLSIMEISHRAKDFQPVVDEAVALFKELLNIPEGYSVLFLGGGASLEFCMIPFNFLEKKAAYLNTGVWAKKAMKEAKAFGEVVEVASSAEATYTYIPKDYTVPADADYFHVTTNNTIYGTELHEDLDSPVPMIADMSSDIFSRPIDVSRYICIYGGAQKNLAPAGVTFVIVKNDAVGKVSRYIPTMLNYQTHIDGGSMFNTPPVLPIYAALQTLRWIKANGGVAEMQKRAKEKADMLYAEIDRNKMFRGTVTDKADRSYMNICFVMNDGTVIVVSHDREFLDGLVDKVYEFGNKRVIEHLGGIYDFLEHKKMDSLCELERSTQTTTSMEGNASEPTRNKLSYEARKEQSKAIKKVEKAIAESEKKITELENSIAAIEAKLATPEGAADVSLYTEYSELKKKLSDTMDLWTEQTLELEELNAANS